MIDPVVMFQEGGPFMVLLLLLGVGTTLAGLAYASIAARRRAPAALALFLAFGPLFVGLMGNQLGMAIAAQALAYASPETRLVLMANGLGVASFTTLGGLLAVLPLLGIATIGAVLGTLRSTTTEDALSARASATVLGMTLFGTVAWFAGLSGRAKALQAVAIASAEAKQALVDQALGFAAQSVVASGVAAATVLVVGLGAMALARRGATRRALVEIGASVLMAAGVLALPALSVSGSAVDLVDEDRAAREAPYLPVRELGIALPEAEACVPWRDGATRVSVGASEIRVDGESVGSPSGGQRDGMHWALFERLDAAATGQAAGDPDYRGILSVDLDADATWGTVRPILAAAAGARFGTVQLDATRGSGLCTVGAELVGPVHASAGTRQDPVSRPADRFAEFHVAAPAAADGPVVRIAPGDPVPDEAAIVEVAPEPDHTVRELVAALEEHSAFRPVRLVLSDEAP